jgi:membrane protein implicated in regulation of membrane protease activity
VFEVLTGTIVFLVIGGVGVAVLALGLIGNELASAVRVDWFGDASTEAVAGFLGVFGFVAALVRVVLGSDDPGALALAGAIGLVAAIPASLLVVRLSRALRDMPTDDTPRRSDLIGTAGVVVTQIPATGYGEVRVRLAGHPVKLNARADQPLAAGTPVLVVEAPSDTSVVVIEALGIRND